MSVIIGTIPTNGNVIKRQSWTRDPSGLDRLLETWLVNTADMPGVLPAIRAVHATFTNLFFQGSTGNNLPLGLTEVTLTYEGATFTGGGGTITTPFYYATTGTMTVPIEQHPDVDTWIASEVAAGRDPRDANGLFQGWRYGAVSSGIKSLYGVTAYEAPTVIWNKEWVTSTAPDVSAVDEIGTVETPDGSPPTRTNTNWLVIENSWREIGNNMYARVKRWKNSQPNSWGGWNTDVY